MTQEQRQAAITGEPGREWQTLSERMHGKPAEREADPAQQLRDLTAEQTRLFNADAPQDQRVRIYNEIKRVQEQRRRKE
jgi:hypothetical protein